MSDRVLCSDASLWCWGSNGFYQLGTGDLIDHDVPVLIDGTDIDHDTFGACGIADGGKVFCWGRAIEGQLGIDQANPVTTPMQTAAFDDVVRITVARFHSCLQRSDYSVWCTGKNDTGLLGTGDFARRYEWTQVL